MKIIYGVSKGEYSDYRVLAIFDTLQKAEGYIASATYYCDTCESQQHVVIRGDDIICAECQEDTLAIYPLTIEELELNPPNGAEHW